MDLINSFIGVLLFTLILAPIIYINNVSNQKHKKVVQKFLSAANSLNFSIKEYEIWTENSAIAISNENNILFSKDKDSFNELITIPYTDILDCNVVTTSKEKHVEKIELKFDLKNNKSISLEFFSVDKNNFIVGIEMRLAKKWHQKIKDILPEKKQLIYSV